jgi:hypothetical protein
MKARIFELVPTTVGDGYKRRIDAILKDAKAEGFADILVIGQKPDGEIVIDGNLTDAEANYLIDLAKRQILGGDE